jgi:hypothetical protein
VPRIEIDTSDLLKLYDTLQANLAYHRHRDTMNAAIHLGVARYSPITTSTEASRDRLAAILDEAGVTPDLEPA